MYLPMYLPNRNAYRTSVTNLVFRNSTKTLESATAEKSLVKFSNKMVRKNDFTEEINGFPLISMEASNVIFL
jgi:hypothetical protein